ncbi:MAG: endonuclease, partial [Muribaculaceae bacterium]|nr:endonuclease [Muribaculaceae bacterium]
MFSRIVSFITIISVSTASLMAASPSIPAGYYNSLNGKSESVLKTAVRNVIYNHTQVSSYSALPQYFQKTDVYPGTRQWWDMYSNIPLYAPSFTGLNREHSFPKSWWGGATTIPAYTDLNHLYPSEAAANMAKSNYPLGTVSRTTGSGDFDNGVSKVGPAVYGQGGGAAKVFEPADEYKGDFARTYFYMVTCYQDLSWKYKYMLSDGVYPTLTQWAQTLLLQWHQQDPVSQKEIDRNEAVYAIQNNRNPFIDFPDLAEYIWGEKRGLPFSAEIPDTPTGDPLLIKPTQNMNLDFGEVAVGKTSKSRIQLLGENLTGMLSLSMDRNSRNNFTISESEISAQLANRTDGYWVDVTYNPTTTGEHTGKFIVYDSGLQGSVKLTIRGECLPEP